MSIKLPISKSIANRILLLQAIHGDPLMRVSSDMPDDVIVLHDALEQLQEYKKSKIENRKSKIVLYLKNCGTALRFLQVHLAKCYPNEPITLTGDPRLMERDGKPTSQTISARILHGENIPVDPNESPYITMSRKIAEAYPKVELEADWSSAAFWYEYVAIHGGELQLDGLKENSLQGDKIVADIYAAHFGVQTEYTNNGAIISNRQSIVNRQLSTDFSNCPDLYPAIALTCEKLGIELQATGIENLHHKESDRLEAVRKHEVRNDHRMAMSLMCADYPVSEADQQCIAKSYPEFVMVHSATTRQRDVIDKQDRNEVGTPTMTHITPIRGVNDDNLGKKHALSKLIHAATSEYVWLHDDDVVLPKACGKSEILEGDLIVLPLRMESLNDKPSLLEKLQIAEYAAIQELTMSTAKRGKAVMCSGANLIVRREVWLACEKDLHPEIPSGDDMFLLEAVKRRGYKIGVLDEPAYTAIVRPLTSWRAFFRQRM
nr:glycosyltransferase [Paludibacteraceae bacterium]